MIYKFINLVPTFDTCILLNNNLSMCNNMILLLAAIGLHLTVKKLLSNKHQIISLHFCLYLCSAHFVFEYIILQSMRTINVILLLDLTSPTYKGPGVVGSRGSDQKKETTYLLLMQWRGTTEGTGLRVIPASDVSILHLFVNMCTLKKCEKFMRWPN